MLLGYYGKMQANYQKNIPAKSYLLEYKIPRGYSGKMISSVLSDMLMMG
jgi:hypothetical protein